MLCTDEAIVACDSPSPHAPYLNPFPKPCEAEMAGLSDTVLWNETRRMFGLPPIVAI